MRHLVSDMVFAFDGELGKFTEVRGIRQYHTAAEAPRQHGSVERS